MIVSNKFRLAYSILCILQIINFTYEESFFQTDIFEKLNQIDTNIFVIVWKIKRKAAAVAAIETATTKYVSLLH